MTARLQTVLERANARELGDAVDGISPDRTRWRVPLVRSCLGWGLMAATCGGAGAAVARPALHARLRERKGGGGVEDASSVFAVEGSIRRACLAAKASGDGAARRPRPVFPLHPHRCGLHHLWNGHVVTSAPLLRRMPFLRLSWCRRLLGCLGLPLPSTLKDRSALTKLDGDSTAIIRLGCLSDGHSWWQLVAVPGRGALPGLIWRGLLPGIAEEVEWWRPREFKLAGDGLPLSLGGQRIQIAL